MLKQLLKSSFVLLPLLYGAITHAQQLNYAFTASASNFSYIGSDGNFVFLSGNGVDALADEGYANEIPIGFSFKFNGVNYSELSVSTNGFITFGTLSGADVLNNLTSGGIGYRPIIAPLWDDLDLQNTTNLKYTTIGSAPNQVFIMEWANAKWGFGSASASLSFQVRLYEGTNIVEFVYKDEGGTPSSPSASIGLTAEATGANNFISLNNTSTAPAASKTTETTTINNKPSNGQSYRFNPNSIVPVVLKNFTGKRVKDNLNQLSWQTESEVNNWGFGIERSADQVHFSSIGFVDTKVAGGNSASTVYYTFNDEQPVNGTSYYRLQQKDKDGHTSYSTVVAVKAVNKDWVNVLVYPNPTKDLLKMQLNADIKGSINITISDASGKKLIQQQQNVDGVNTTSVTTNVAQLPAGTYWITLMHTETGNQLVKSFVKQ